MARVAPRVHVTADALARLEALGAQLLQDEHVRILLGDGTTVDGIVECQPSVQMFFDPQGREGSNALVRIEPLFVAGRTAGDAFHDLWLDDIREVTRLPNPSPPEPSRRTSPPDPNAPSVR